MEKPVISRRTVIQAWLLVGTLDILAACISYWLRTGKNPVAVLRFVASGLFGQNAFTDSMMPVWGLLFHYLIALGFTVAFFWIYPRLRLFAINRYLLGIAYGAAVWAVMNLIVVPLSNTPKSPLTLSSVLISMSILMLVIGIPLSLIAARQQATTSGA